MLKEQEPELADELERIGWQLDEGNLSSSFSTFGERDLDNLTEDIGKERRHLAGMWEEVVERVRWLSQFEYFLRPVLFPKLRQTANDGQVIIINASTYGVDALVFGATGPVEHVSLPDINLETLAKLADNIVSNNPVNASASQWRTYTTRYLKPALRVIWNDILIQIFDKIQVPLTNIVAQPQRRIWWYPTGPLTFIPIHAAGPGRRIIDTSHSVISSYVTTLQSLVQTQKQSGLVSQGPRKLLIVSQPRTPNESPLPKTVEEVDSIIQVFSSSGWFEKNIVCLRGSEATMDCVSNELDTCSWVHFACHAIQDPPSFLLHDGHLRLSEIASKRLFMGQFSFLSACYAAAGLTTLPGEVMHLTAGLQFAGFPSVIASMWNIRDEDAPKVAFHTYQYLFCKGLQGLDPSEAAIALNRAILHLREDPNVMVDQWAPFIHYGI